MPIVAALTDQLLTLVLGFVLTTVAGSLLGSRFQQRAWDHQNEMTLQEADRGHAVRICGDLSQLLDKRLYRMRQLNWALGATEVDRPRIDSAMVDYRTVLYEWNDKLNHNLAAAESQFGADIRSELEIEIYERFAAVGRDLEARYRRLSLPRSRAGEVDSERPSTTLNEELGDLSDRIYAFNLLMLVRIREGRVGRNAPGSGLRPAPRS